jgi:type IV fimbrial biogenesis protein FimT
MRMRLREQGGKGRPVRGFTLAELLVVLTVLSVLAVVAVPSLSTFTAGQRVKESAVNIYSALVTARAEAVKRNANVALTPAAAGWQGGWQIADPATSGRYLLDQTLTGVTVSGPSGTGGIVYQSSGRILGTSSGAFQFSGSSTDVLYCVKVTVSGRPYLSKGACT